MGRAGTGNGEESDMADFTRDQRANAGRLGPAAFGEVDRVDPALEDARVTQGGAEVRGREVDFLRAKAAVKAGRVARRRDQRPRWGEGQGFAGGGVGEGAGNGGLDPRRFVRSAQQELQRGPIVGVHGVVGGDRAFHGDVATFGVRIGVGVPNFGTGASSVAVVIIAVRLPVAVVVLAIQAVPALIRGAGVGRGPEKDGAGAEQ